MKWQVAIVCLAILFTANCPSLGKGRASEAKGVPVILDWSSHGGRVKNKEDERDRMYLVQSGDRIIFQVKARNAREYEWQVNKVVQEGVTGSSFIWVVPEGKGIWEIHVVARGEGGETHHEWVVSNLSGDEAPDFFDYFTDGRWRDRSETDPWGRPLPEWMKNDRRPGEVEPDASCYVLRMQANLFNNAWLYARLGIAYGTWICKFRVTPPMGKRIKREQGRVTIGFYPLVGGERNGPIAGIRMAAEFQGHNWPFVQFPDGKRITASTMPLVGAWGISDSVSFADDEWKVLKVIRTPDGYIRFWKGRGLYGHNGYFNDSLINSSPLKPGEPDLGEVCPYIGLAIRQDGNTKHWGEIDCIEVYKDKFISPKRICYGKYVNFYKQEKPGEPYVPVYREGILVDGFGVRLADIARAINDPSLFRYDPETRSADCYTDICVMPGAELVLKGEMLRMHPRSDGELQIRVKNGATIWLEGATITSPGHPYKWVFPSEFTPSSEYSSSYQSNFTGRFIARNSLIGNCGGIYLAGAMEVVLENVEFTDLVEVEYPPPPHRGVVFSNWCKDSGQRHALSFRGHQVCSRFLIRGCTFSASEKATMKFISMDPVVSNCTIYDSRLKGIRISAKDGYFFYWGYRHPTTLNLVNTKFEEIARPEGDSSVVVRYYLDVKVVDERGRPVQGASVKVINEVERRFTPLEEILRRAGSSYSLEIDMKAMPINLRELFFWAPEVGYAKQREIAKITGKKAVVGQCLIGRRMPCYGKPMSLAVTGANGHIPLPEEGKGAIALTDFVLERSGKREFTYTILAEKDGLRKVITGVNPGPHWYRPDPNEPTYTIIAVLDSKRVTELELKAQGLAGPTKELEGSMR